MALPATERIVPVSVQRIELEAAVAFGTLRRAFEAEVPPLDVTRLRELLSGAAGRGLDAGLFWAMVETWHREHDTALVRGAAAGLLYGAGHMDEAQLARSVEGHFSGLSQAREAVAYLLVVTVAEALNLERALGYRANQDGTSFAAPPQAMLGSYHVGTPLLTVHADRSRPHG